MAKSSWRRDPGVYPAASWRRGNGDNKAAHRGDHVSAVNHSRGESRDVRVAPWFNPCAFFYPSHTGLRAQSAPGFPCAL